MKTIERLKEDVSIEEVLAYFGANVGGYRGTWGEWQAIRCPFHDDKQASGSLNRRRGRFNCHACDAGGDIIDIAKDHLNTSDTRQAIEWLERTFA